MRSIKNLLFTRALIPVAVLALVLAVANGVMRYQDAEDTLRKNRAFIVQLLNQPAQEAIVIGNTAYLEAYLRDLAKIEHGVLCISVNDNEGVTLAQLGECAGIVSSEDTSQLYGEVGSLDELNTERMSTEVVGNATVVMNPEVLRTQRATILGELALSLLGIGFMIMLVVRLLNKRIVRPVNAISAVMSEVRNQNYDERIGVGEHDDELGQLSVAINTTIEEMQTHTGSLEKAREDAEKALITADAAYVDKEAVLQSMIQEVSTPTKEINRQLMRLALESASSEYGEQIRTLAALAKKSDDNISQVIDLVSGINAVSDGRETDHGSVLESITRGITQIDRNSPTKIHFTKVQTINEGELAERKVVADTDKLNRLVHHIADGMAKHLPCSAIYITLHLIEGPAESVNYAFDFKTHYDLDRSHETTREMVRRGLPVDFGVREQHLVRLLARELNVVVNSLQGDTGALSISFSWKAPTEEAMSLTQAESLKGQRIAVVSNDNAADSLALKAQLEGATLVFMEPAEFMAGPGGRSELFDIVCIDIGEGTMNDFDPSRIMGLFKTLNANAIPKFIAIAHAEHLSERMVEKLFNEGYSAMLNKPLTWPEIKKVITSVNHQHIGGLF